MNILTQPVVTGVWKSLARGSSRSRLHDWWLTVQQAGGEGGKSWFLN